MLFLTQGMSKRHKLHKKGTFAISSNDKEIELLKSTKLVGVTVNENLKWKPKMDGYVNKILKTLY